MTSNCSTFCVCFFVQTAKFMLVVYNMIFSRPAGKSKNCVWPFLVEKQTERAPHASKSSKFIAFFFIRHWWFQCTSFIYIDPYLDTLSLQSTQIWMDGQNLFSIIIAHYCDLCTFKTNNIRLDPSFMLQCEQKDMIVLPHQMFTSFWICRVLLLRIKERTWEKNDTHQLLERQLNQQQQQRNPMRICRKTIANILCLCICTLEYPI